MSKGEKNGYQCPNLACGFLLVTMDVDDGVTPMTKRCPKCSYTAHSMFYRIDQSLPHDGEWYSRKPNRSDSHDMREHLRLGGLDYREVPA